MLTAPNKTALSSPNRNLGARAQQRHSQQSHRVSCAADLGFADPLYMSEPIPSISFDLGGNSPITPGLIPFRQVLDTTTYFGLGSPTMSKLTPICQDSCPAFS